MSASFFEHKPETCPYGHALWPGRAQVAWMPCVCEAAREAADRGRGLGHVTVICNACHDERRESTFFEPPHDRAEWLPSGWTTRPGT